MINKNFIPHFHLITWKKDGHRPQMSHVRVGRDFIVSTDATVIAWAKTNDVFGADFTSELFNNFGDDYCIDGEYMYIAPEDWKLITQSKVVRIDGMDIICQSGKGGRIIRPVKDPLALGKYPAWRNVIPTGGWQPSNIALNAELLYNLGKCIRWTGLHLLTEDKGRGILAIANNEDVICMGLIMPILFELKGVTNCYHTLKP